MRWLCYSFSGAALLLAGLSFHGALHPAGDSLAVFRPVWTLLLVLAALWASALEHKKLAGVLTLGAILCMTSVFVSVLPRAEPGRATLTLYQKNMLFIADTTTTLEADIRALAPDIVTLQEVSPENRAILTALKDLYPHQAFCPFSAVGGVAVLSRLPPIDTPPACQPQNGLVAMEVTGPSGPLWVASLHLHWPWPFQQAAQAARLRPWFEAHQTQLILAGDFNMIPWSHRLRSIERQTGTIRTGPAPVTFWIERGRRLYPIQIDHVLGPLGGTLKRRPLLASDHHGLFATLQLP